MFAIENQLNEKLRQFVRFAAETLFVTILDCRRRTGVAWATSPVTAFRSPGLRPLLESTTKFTVRRREKENQNLLGAHRTTFSAQINDKIHEQL